MLQAIADRMNVHIGDIAALDVDVIVNAAGQRPDALWTAAAPAIVPPVAFADMAAGIEARASFYRRSPRAFSALRRRRPLQWRSPPCGLGLASIPGPGM
jgi:hypothetical protein